MKVRLGETEIHFVATAPWDGSPRGRVGAIVRPRCNCDRVADFLKTASPVVGAAAEALNPTPWSTGASGDSAEPFVLFSRYRDNIYVAIANVPADIPPHLKFVISVFLRFIDNIPPKWKPHGQEVVWGESVLALSEDRHRLSMYRKGVCRSLSSVSESLSFEWDRWVGPDSPNAKLL